MPVSESMMPARLLEPVDRIAEVLFGLIMVLTFTGSLSIAADRSEVGTMLIGALGCNLAWGIIDAVLYLMGSLAEKGRGIAALAAVRSTRDSDRARELIAGALPPVIARVLTPAEYRSLHQRLLALGAVPERARLERSDWLGGLAVFGWVFATTFPVAVPFLVMDEAGPALRVSNGIAVGMLFAAGYAYGRCIGRKAWAVAIAMVALGAVLVAMTIALGG